MHKDTKYHEQNYRETYEMKELPKQSKKNDSLPSLIEVAHDLLKDKDCKSGFTEVTLKGMMKDFF